MRSVGRSYCDYVLVMSNVYHKRAKSTRRLAIVRCLYAMVRENTMASPSCDGKRGGDTTSIHWSARRPPHRPMETLIDTILVYGASPAQFVRCLSLCLHHQTASSVNPNSVTMLVNSHSQQSMMTCTSFCTCQHTHVICLTRGIEFVINITR